jgi:hypothetical protein
VPSAHRSMPSSTPDRAVVTAGPVPGRKGQLYALERAR